MLTRGPRPIRAPTPRSVEVLTLRGLTRYFVFFILELKIRRVKIAGIHSQPYGEWMELMPEISRTWSMAFSAARGT